MNVWFELPTWLGIAALLANFLYAHWTLDPLYDFLYLRTDGVILAFNHVSSSLAVGLTVSAWVILNRKTSFTSALVVMSIVPLHELTLDLIMSPLHLQTLTFDPSLRWLFWLGVILIGGLLFSTKKQKIVYLRLTILTAGYVLIWFSFILWGLDPNTLVHTQTAIFQGSAYLNPASNLFEIGSWLILVYGWWKWN